jgi:hypothetical protein
MNAVVKKTPWVKETVPADTQMKLRYGPGSEELKAHIRGAAVPVVYLLNKMRRKRTRLSRQISKLEDAVWQMTRDT